MLAPMSTTPQPATPAQEGYLRSLAAQRAIYGTDLDPEATRARMIETLDAGLTREAASALIDRALRAPAHPAEVRPAGEHALNYLRSSAATLALFGLEVSKEETMARVEEAIAAGLTDADMTSWRHRIRTAKPHPTAKSPLPLSKVEGIEGLSISEGCYAVLVPGASDRPGGVLRFYRIYTPTTGEYQDQVVMRRYASENLLALYPDEAREALHAIDADPDAAAYRFADEFTRCYVCTRQLTDAISRLLSVGPHCRGFSDHSGLRREATLVDTDPARRQVYRAIREWALTQGFHDPRSKTERESMEGQMTASRLASAWSGLPGLLTLPPEDAVTAIQQAVAGEVTTPIRDGLAAAPTDTLMLLIDSGVLSAPVLELLTQHPDRRVQERATTFFLSLLEM